MDQLWAINSKSLFWTRARTSPAQTTFPSIQSLFRVKLSATTLLSLFLYSPRFQALLYFTYTVISYVIPHAFWFTCLYVHWPNYTAAEGSELLQLWQQHNTAPIKPEVVKISSCRLCSQSYCSKANRHNDSPLHPTAQEDAMVCGLCFISGTRNLLLDWYANVLPAVPESIFLEKEEPLKNNFGAETGSWFFKSVVPTGDRTTGWKEIKIQTSSPPASATHAGKPTGLFGSGDRADLLVASESLPVARQIIFSSELSVLSFQAGKSEQHHSGKKSVSSVRLCSRRRRVTHDWITLVPGLYTYCWTHEILKVKVTSTSQLSWSRNGQAYSDNSQ